MIFECFIHKIENFIRNFLCFIKENLFFVILPVQSKILNTYCIPVICKLHTGCVHNPLDFIWNQEFKILNIEVEIKNKNKSTYLGSIFITNEETVFNFDDTNKVIFLFNFGFLLDLLLLLFLQIILRYLCFVAALIILVLLNLLLLVLLSILGVGLLLILLLLKLSLVLKNNKYD